MKIGDNVRIKNGATEWMKKCDYWLDTMPDNIDGMNGKIISDYTNFNDDTCHYEIDLGLVYGIGVHPKWLEVL